MAQATRLNGPKGGRLSLMDAAFSMYANLTGDIGLIKVLGDSTADQTPLNTNAKVFRDNEPYVVTINSPALNFLEGESRGEVSGDTDSIYTKTLPWVLSWISKVCYSGNAPFYNKNRRDASGNYLTPDGKIYKTSDGIDQIYKSSWRTSQYRIRSRDLIWTGLGGANVAHNVGETTRLATTDPDYGTLGWKGKSYLIPEIPYTEAQRAVASDEEALYRNFQWLLYEKRFVLIIPIRTLLFDNQVSATGSGTIQFQDGIFITVTANGLKGLMSAKPYCSLTACDRLDNGKWLKANTAIKSDYRVQGPLNYFSSIPGDASILVEVWGYGVQGAGGIYSFLDDIIFNTVYTSIIFTKSTQPERFYGPIPPVISELFPAIELLGFVKDNSHVDKLVPPSKVGTYWENRNRLLPLIVAFAKTLYDQTDRVNNKNAFEYITRLTDILNRPFLLYSQEPYARVAEPSVPEVKLVKIRVASLTTSTTPSMRSPDLDSVDYLPHSTELLNSDSRSLLSFLIEDGRRQVDGLLPLLSKKQLISNFVSIVSELGASKRSTGRKLAIQGIQKVLPEVEVATWDRTDKLNIIETNPTDPVKFNLQSSIDSTEFDIVHFTDTRGFNIQDSSWNDINIVLNIIYDFLSFDSPYSAQKNIDWLYEILIGVKPTSSEITAIFDNLSSILFDRYGNKDYLLTKLINNRLPKLLSVISPDIKYLAGVVRGLLRDNGFFIYIEAKMITGYSIGEILWDTEGILVSSMIQERNSFYDSLLISAGTLLKYLANVTERGGNRPDADPYHDFYDHKNKEDKMSSYYKRLNLILSKKD